MTKPARQRTYAAIDLKSFYASVECNERGLNPLTANLVVADRSRTEKTICLAVSPSLKAIGIPGRARLFEVTEKVKLHNAQRLRRLRKMGISDFEGRSCDSEELAAHPELELDFIAAKPRMKYYMNYSARIYNIYLKYIAPEDIHVYSIDEVFMDLTEYLGTYGITAAELVQTMIRDVLGETGITATAGIGPNLYLAKIAMDIVAWMRDLTGRSCGDTSPLLISGGSAGAMRRNCGRSESSQWGTWRGVRCRTRRSCTVSSGSTRSF